MEDGEGDQFKTGLIYNFRCTIDSKAPNRNSKFKMLIC